VSVRTAALIATVAIAASACAAKKPPAAPIPRPAPAIIVPPLVIGRFADDYGSNHTVTADEWLHEPHNKYHIAKWVAGQEYLVAYNDVNNPADGGKWTRIDWVQLPGMPPYEWGFCLSAYKAATAAEAEATTTANRASPRTGCNGFPFTRMKKADR
jgi:hypothetical protein